MSGFLEVARSLGVGSLLRLRNARTLAWEQLISPHFSTRVLQTMFNVGLMDAFKQNGPVDVLAFAQERDLEGSTLVALCEAMYARKILLRTAPSTFQLDETGRFFVEEPMVRGWFELAYGYENVLYGLEDIVRKKVQYGKDGFVRDGRYVATGSGLASLRFYFPLAVETLRRTGAKRVLDIGCGDGTFLRFLNQQCPEVRGVGVDLSEAAVEAGNEQLQAQNLSDKIQLHACNALYLDRLKPQLEGVDGATTFFVLHELCDKKENPLLMEFLTKFKAVLGGVPFHIFEAIRPDASVMRKKPGPAIEYFLFHDLSNQKPLAREEWKRAFKTAGFTTEERYIDFAKSSVFTIR